MAAAVSFNYSTWILLFPEFTGVPQEAAQAYFDMATMYWRNDGTSPNTSPASQTTLLNMMTAHIVALFRQSQGQPSPGAPQDANSPVGRVSSVTQGSITVVTELDMAPTSSGMEAWCRQTKYGLSFWAMTGAYRRFKYTSAGYNMSGFPFGRGGVP